MGHPSDRRIARSSWEPREKETRAGGDGECKAERDEAKRWDRHEGLDAAVRGFSKLHKPMRFTLVTFVSLIPRGKLSKK